MDHDNDTSNPSTQLDKSGISLHSNTNAEDNSLLDALFPSQSQEILMVVTYEQIIFMDNNSRDRTILEIKYDDLLYVMGKNDLLKISFQVR